VIANGWTNAAFRSRVTLIPGKVTEDAITKLHFMNNVYVSSSRGEAWNLGAFAAKVAGNRLVYVPYGGTEDFSDASDVKIPFHMAPVPESYRWEPGAEWADFDTDALCVTLAGTQAPTRFERPAWFESHFSLASVGTLMRKLVLEVAAAVPAAAAYYGG